MRVGTSKEHTHDSRKRKREREEVREIKEAREKERIKRNSAIARARMERNSAFLMRLCASERHQNAHAPVLMTYSARTRLVTTCAMIAAPIPRLM